TLSLGTPIVSESSSDIEEEHQDAGVIDFCPVGDIRAMVAKLRARCLMSNTIATSGQQLRVLPPRIRKITSI
ncbi:hypothetical protein DMH17_16790, partial [Raoultella planticola]|nr:hypothetical protein [Raoultella planticola]